MIKNNIKGILVGCDDVKCNFTRGNEAGGYCWVIEKKDWDTGSNVITDKIVNYYRQIIDFHIYFYVYKDKKPYPADDSYDFRDTIFGFADVVYVKKNMYNNPDFYKHHVKVENVRLFTPKIQFSEFCDQLEYCDWSDRQLERFGFSLTTNGLLLTNNDCDFLQSFKFENSR